MIRKKPTRPTTAMMTQTMGPKPAVPVWVPCASVEVGRARADEAAKEERSAATEREAAETILVDPVVFMGIAIEC